MQHGSDYTPYEGLEVTGWPIKTLVRGVVVADNGCVVGGRGFGQFLPRETSNRLLKKSGAGFLVFIVLA